MAHGQVGDILGLNPWLGPEAASRAQMVLWAPPCQLKLGFLLPWGRGVELGSWGERAGLMMCLQWLELPAEGIRRCERPLFGCPGL
jgi:hypothetical protein